MISVLQLGTLDYSTGLRLQKKLVDLRKEGRVGDVLLLLEHTPVITLGRNANAKNVLAAPEKLTEHGVGVFDCDRGGDVTFHGPGQLVGYPIFDLRGFPSGDAKRKTLGVIEYVRRLEEVLIRTCADFRIPAERVAGLTGVWTRHRQSDIERAQTLAAQPGDNTKRPKRPNSDTIEHNIKDQAKIAAIGVHISRGVTSHGFALNVNTDLSFFNLIVPCGITNKPVTSIEKETGNSVPLDEVAHSVARNFGNVFHSQILWLDTLEALLGATVGIPARPPEELRQLHGDDETHWA